MQTSKVPMGWTEALPSFVFVSDESRLDDFNLADGEIKRISEELGFCVSSADLLIDIALRMRQQIRAKRPVSEKHDLSRLGSHLG